jgi:hypothetical protein
VGRLGITTRHGTLPLGVLKKGHHEIMSTAIIRAMMVWAVLASCESTQAIPDGSPSGADAAVQCDALSPAVRAHLTFGFSSDSSTPLWAGGRDALTLFTRGGLEQRYDFFSSLLDTEHRATAILRYPVATSAGPASISFYAIVGTEGNWGASANFTADPQSCVDVNLFVPFIPCCSSDAGVP